MDQVFRLGARDSRVRSFPGNRIEIDAAAEALWVCDQNTQGFLPKDAGSIVCLAPGEAAKTWESVQKIIDAALEERLGRDGLIIALGGGVVCDTAAFAAAIYMRGCRLMLIPSTLLSMIDASLGGKTGVDYRDYKNIIGSFYPAEEIRLYPFLLASLPEIEYRSGLAEVLKHALLEKSNLFLDLEANREAVLARDGKLLEELIPRSLAVKGRLVEEDPTEKGVRAYLNLGHTFGHALERELGLGAVPHGYAVAWGIARAMEAGLALGLTDSAYADRVIQFFTDYGYDLKLTTPSLEAFLSSIALDKKRKGGAVRFVLQRNQGETLQQEIPEEILRRVLAPFAHAR